MNSPVSVCSKDVESISDQSIHSYHLLWPNIAASMVHRCGSRAVTRDVSHLLVISRPHRTGSRYCCWPTAQNKCLLAGGQKSLKNVPIYLHIFSRAAPLAPASVAVSNQQVKSAYIWLCLPSNCLDSRDKFHWPLNAKNYSNSQLDRRKKK